MSHYDVDAGMRGRQAADARAEKLLAGGEGDSALSSFLHEVRTLATATPPEPRGDLAVLLQDGFTPEPATAPAPVSRRTPLRRWMSRTAVLASPVAWKVAAAATAAAATAGGMAAAGALPDAAQRWVSETAAILHIDLPHPDDRTPLRGMLPLTQASEEADASADRPTGPNLGSPDTDVPPRPAGGEHTRRRDDRDRRRDAEDRAEDEADEAEDRADAEADAAEDRADAEADAAEDRADAEADAAEDRADAEADAAEDRADAQADAAERRARAKRDAAAAEARRAREEAEAAEEAAEEAEDAAEDAADAAEDAEENTGSDD